MNLQNIVDLIELKLREYELRNISRTQFIVDVISIIKNNILDKK